MRHRRLQTSQIVALLAAVAFASPAIGNISPESAYLVHVQPSTGNPCLAAVENCNQIVRSTSEGGLIDFQIYLYPRAFVGNHYAFEHVSLDLVWPAGWQLMAWSPCNDGVGTLEPNGTKQHLDVTWANCPTIAGQLFHIATLTLDVTEPGRLDFDPPWGIDTWLGCPPGGFNSNAGGYYAEAAMDCEYNLYKCASGNYCAPIFTSTELSLTTTQGGTVIGSLPFQAWSAIGPIRPCVLTTSSQAPWASPTIVAGTWPNYTLEVSCSASGLEEGSYDTSIQVVGDQFIARCAHVHLEVEGTAGVPESPPMNVRVHTWGAVKSIYR